MVTNTIEIQGSLKASDLIRAQYFQSLRLVWPLVLLLAPIPPLDALLFWLGGDWTSIATNILPLSLLILFLLLLPPVAARWQLKTRRHLSEEVRYSFDAEGVRLAAPSFSVSVKWQIIRAIRETKTAFLLYEGPGIARIVPKRFFASEGELVAWKVAVASWIAPRSIHEQSFVGKWC